MAQGPKNDIITPEVLADFYQNPVQIIPIDDHRFTLTLFYKITQETSPQIMSRDLFFYHYSSLFSIRHTKLRLERQAVL